MNRAYLLLGGNMGDRLKFLEKAVSEIGSFAGKVLQRSSIYETKAWGKKEQGDFLNQALVIETLLEPFELLDKLLGIERYLGRTRDGSKWSERKIDIDILFFLKGAGKKPVIMDEEKLMLPHPHIHHRRFTLEPLNEIAGNLVHPVLNKTISELLSECDDHSEVRKILPC